MTFAPLQKKQSGFTLIEMLIVITILGILIAALIPKVVGLKQKANNTKAQSDLKTISVWVLQAEINTNKLLKDITWSICTEFTCRGLSTPLWSLASNHACRINWMTSISIIAQEAGEAKAEDFFVDPWWAPYLLDENEAELSWSDCRFDSIQSAWPDGVWVQDNNIYPNQNDTASNHAKNKDNILGNLRPVRCKGAY